MRKIITNSKKANRSSAYSKGPSFRGQSNRRKRKRAYLQPAESRTFGFPKKKQTITVKGRFKTWVKTIYHILYNY